MPTNEKCLFCLDGLLHREVRPETYSYKDHSIEVGQPGMYCDSCGESVLNAADLKVTRHAIHNLHASGNCFLTSVEVRRIRAKLNLTQQKAGEIFGGGINAFSRYERGEAMQPRATDKLLRLLDQYPDLLDNVISDPCENKMIATHSSGWSSYPTGVARASVTFRGNISGDLVLHNSNYGAQDGPNLTDLPLAA